MHDGLRSIRKIYFELSFEKHARRLRSAGAQVSVQKTDANLGTYSFTGS